LFAFAFFCYHDEINGRLGANQGFYRCDCQDISLFSESNKTFSEEFNCSQAALLSYLLNNSGGIINGTIDGNASFITEVFDYRGSNTVLPFFDCNMYDEILRNESISFNITKLVSLVADDTVRIFQESDAICNHFPNETLF